MSEIKIKKNKQCRDTCPSADYTYGLIGHPVHHSLSPVIQQKAFLAAGIPNAEYNVYDVSPKKLKSFLKTAQKDEIRGLNVTMPYKEEVMKHVLCDQKTQHIGAVNTLVLTEGKFLGFNTDGMGFLDSLAENGQRDLNGKTVLILGAGGASRAICFSLKQKGAFVYIVNRTPQKAVSLVKAVLESRNEDGCEDKCMNFSGAGIQNKTEEKTRFSA